MKRITKKDLQRQIRELEEAIRIYEQKAYATATINELGLPKCESELCHGCMHAVFAEPIFGHAFPILLGCSKDIACKDFASIAGMNVLCPNSHYPDCITVQEEMT